jgi:hypothetical protein
MVFEMVSQQNFHTLWGLVSITKIKLQLPGPGNSGAIFGIISAFKEFFGLEFM